MKPDLEAIRARDAQNLDPDWPSAVDRRALLAHVDELLAERALLVTRAENAEAALVEADKDAERYRWLRDATGWSIHQWLGLSGVWTEYLSGKNLDAAIDAAMGESHE